MSEVSVSRGDGLVDIRADGGTRRERGRSIAVTVRRLRAEGVRLQRFYITYDEAHGFLPRTWARYREVTNG